MAPPLSGLRALDFGQYIAGPLVAMLLADQGAEVIRIDPPGGPRWATAANRTWNRGKRSIVLDLHTPRDQAIARELVGSADILVENFRPGVMDRLGLGAAELLARQPRLIYCSLPGFAADDPRAAHPAWEGVIAAATDTYRPATEPDRPVFTPVPIASHFAAIVAAVSITMALIARERDGVGQRIEVPLFDAMFAAIGAHGLQVDGRPGGGRPDDYWTGLFQCADQRWVQLSAATPRFRQQLAAGLGLDDWVAQGLFDLDRLGADPALRRELQQRQRALFASRPAQAWEDLAAELGVPIAVCRSTAEWMRTEHARAAGIVLEVDDPELGPMQQPGPPVRLGTEPVRTPEPAPRLDADRAAILAELQREPRQPPAAAPRPATGPPGAAGPRGGETPTRTAVPGRPALDGLRVLDLTQVLAGPTAGRTLAEFGADVIKVNNPNEAGAGIHFSVHRYHTDVNRAKRTLLLDLKTPAGQAMLAELIDRSDVLLQNFRLGVADQLGIGYETVRQRRPNIVYVSVSAFGYPGPWGARPGYEVQGQAVAGLRFNGQQRPAGQPFAVNDYGTGLLGAFAAGLALYQRCRTGAGQQVEAALAYTATLLQSASLHDYAGKVWSSPPADALGWSPAQRLYQASDGWFFVGAHPEQLASLVPDVGAEALEAALTELFRSAPVASWVERLSQHGIGAQRLVPIAELMRDPWVTQHGLSLSRPHDTGQQITTIGPSPRLSRTPVQPGRPAASPGADAADVLRELGRGHQLDQLVRERVIAIERPHLEESP